MASQQGNEASLTSGQDVGKLIDETLALARSCGLFWLANVASARVSTFNAAGKWRATSAIALARTRANAASRASRTFIRRKLRNQ